MTVPTFWYPIEGLPRHGERAVEDMVHRKRTAADTSERRAIVGERSKDANDHGEDEDSSEGDDEVFQRSSKLRKV